MASRRIGAALGPGWPRAGRPPLVFLHEGLGSLGQWRDSAVPGLLADKLAHVVTRLREMSPLYEMHKEGIDISTIQWAEH